MTKEQVEEFFHRYRQKQRNLAVGRAIRKKGRPAKDCAVKEEDKIAELRYAIARKEARIKQLEISINAILNPIGILLLFIIQPPNILFIIFCVYGN